MFKRIYIKCLIVISFMTISVKATAQLPLCDKIYYDQIDLLLFLLGLPTSNEIYTYDPTLPVGATNPSLNTIGIDPNHGGLTVSTVLGSTNPTRTFYTTINGKYWYYDPVTLAWVNTGHGTGNIAAVNIGAGGKYIYNLVGATGKIYRYDGTSNGTLLITAPNFITEGPYDLIADCDGNFYLFNGTGTNNPTFLRKYNSNGVLLQEWTVNNPNGYSPSGGFAIVGNTFYMDDALTGSIASGSLAGTTLNLNATSAPIPQLGLFGLITDLGSCDAAIPRFASIEIASSDTIMCKTRKVDFWVTDVQIPGSLPVYQWFVNGVAVAGANDTFYGYTPQNGDIVTCQLISSDLCVVTNTVLSNQITIVAEHVVQPELSYKNNVFCSDLNENLLPTINTTGGTFSAEPSGLSIDANTGKITPSTSTPGEYVITYLNPPPIVCPQYSATTTITVYPPAEAKIEIDDFPQPVCMNDTVVLHAKERKGNAYWWESYERVIGTNTRPEAVVKRNKEGYMSLTVIAKGGCSAKDSVWIDAGKSCCQLFIPNAFSPNSDGFNDKLEIQTRDIQAITSFRVFNRYGQVVFEASNKEEAWDGKYKDRLCDIGVYNYMLIYSCDDGKFIQKKGEITLIR